MDFVKYDRKFNNKEYVFGRTVETEYYIIIAKIEDKKYMLTLLKNHLRIYQSFHEGLTLTKFHAFEWLINHDSSIFINNKVTMVHYKEERPNGNPWIKDTNIELKKNLEAYLRVAKVRPKQVILKELNKTQENNIQSLIEDDILSIGEKEVTETEKEQFIKSRIGQSIFKESLLVVGKKCRLCGISDERFLIASHIKPWSKSNHQERLDVNNGLLLCPNHDALFDKGYISFEGNGQIMISNSLDETTKQFLNIQEKMIVRFNVTQQAYMKWHREQLFRS